MFDDLIQKSEQVNDKDSVNNTIPSLGSNYLYRDTKIAKKTADGWETLKRFEQVMKMFDDTPFAPSEYQEMLNGHIKRALVYRFFGDDLYMNEAQLLKKYGWECINFLLNIIARRRAGKTTVMVTNIAGVMLAHPCEQVMFSTGKRLSTANLKKVLKMLILIMPDIMDRLITCNAETLEFIRDDGKTSKLQCLPSSKKISIRDFIVFKTVIEIYIYMCVGRAFLCGVFFFGILTDRVCARG